MRAEPVPIFTSRSTWFALVSILAIAVWVDARVASAQATEPPSDAPVLLDFGQAIAPSTNVAPAEATQSGPATQDASPAATSESLPPTPPAPPAPPPPPAAQPAPAPSNIPVAVPLDTREGGTDAMVRVAAYFEFLGPGFLYSINADLVIDDDVALRVGYTNFTFFGSVELIPITVSYLGYGSANHRYELGAGLSVSLDGFDDEAIGVLLFGYRYQAVSGGLIFRTGLSGLWSPELIAPIPWPYASVGATF